jgi:hypothetical protein
MNSGRGLKASPDSYGEFGYADEIQHSQSPDAAFALISRERSDAVIVDASLPIKRAAELALRSLAFLTSKSSFGLPPNRIAPS